MSEESAEKKPYSVYNGTVESASLSGEATITLEEDGLIIDSLFNQIAVAYSDIDCIELENYSVLIGTKGEQFRVSRLGQQTQWLHRDLLGCYNERVLKALHINENPDFVGKGRASYPGNDGTADLQLFSDSLCILPPNRAARRIPFIFMNGLKKEDFTLTISAEPDGAYSLSMLGYDLDPLEKRIAGGIQGQREANRAFIKDIDENLTFSDAAKAAGLLPEGVAAPLSSLPEALAASIEKFVRNSKIGAVYGQLREIGDVSMLSVGIKTLPEETVAQLKENAGESTELTDEQEDALRRIVWAVVPSKDGQYAVVEFAFPNEAAATYVYRTDGSFKRFLSVLNRGLEATELEREVFSLPEEKLSENMRMLTERTPAIGTLRELFVGKAIHRGADSWKNSVLALTKTERRV